MSDAPPITDALALAQSDKDEWHQAHQGELMYVVADVWECGDEWCGCSQARIVAWFRNLTDRRFRVPRGLWEGPFHTEYEEGASEELEERLRELRASEPSMLSFFRHATGKETHDE